MAYSFLLKQARKQLKMSLREAAAMLRMSPSTLNRYEEGVIAHIPPQKILTMIRGYGLSPESIRRDGIRRDTIERLSRYEESQHRIDADFLYERYLSLDERGRRNVLLLLMHESDVTAQLRSAQKTPPLR